MNTFVTIALAVLVVAALLTVWRAVRPGTLGDRALAFDMLAAIIGCGLFVGAIVGDGLLLDLALLFGLLGYLTAVTVSRYVERRGS